MFRADVLENYNSYRKTDYTIVFSMERRRFFDNKKSQIPTDKKELLIRSFGLF